MHGGYTHDNRERDEIAELLVDRADEAIVERVANIGATVDEVAEAIEHLDYQTRFERTRLHGRSFEN